MKYMLLIYLEEQVLSQAEREHCYQESTQFANQLNSKGQYLAAAPLQPTSTATSVAHATVNGSSQTVRSQKHANNSAATSWWRLGILTRRSTLPPEFQPGAGGRSKSGRSSRLRTSRRASVCTSPGFVVQL